jgi:2-polyprenyl-3-methyl-5-hydroxy-6-metoxy-1,4-benzoquinol methylase
MGLESVTSCPVCLSIDLADCITTKDFTTTNEVFKIVKCQNCGFLISSPRPTPESIHKYYQSEKYISHTGGGKGLMDKVYILARNITLRWKYQLLSSQIEKGNVLDFGCGTGEFLKYLQVKGWNVTGVEPSTNARKKAEELLKTPVMKSLHEVGEKKFHVITLWHVLEHVHNLTETIQKLKSLLTEDGIIFIAVPNHESKDARVYQQYWAAYDVPRHLWHFSKDVMKLFLHNNGLSIKAIKPMKLDAFYVSMLSEGYKNPAQNKFISLAKAFARGLASNFVGRRSTNHSSLIYIVNK